jgi:hypothetical protein
MAGATPLRYGRMGLWSGIIILSARVALKTQILCCNRVEVLMLSTMGLMARLTLPLRYGLMDIFIQLCRTESFMAGVAHLRHRFKQVCAADYAMVAVAALAVLLLYRRMNHLLLGQGVIFFMTFEACLLNRNAAGLARATSPHQCHTHTHQQHIAEITLH